MIKNYIQIGSNNGNDSFFEFIKTLNIRSNVYLIEPNCNLIENIHTTYNTLKNVHNIIILNIGITHNLDINKLYLYEDDHGGVLTSVINRKSYNANRKEIYFESMTFEILCKKFDINEIELLYIDTEGYDYMILNSIDINKIPIQLIKCEKWPYEIDSSDLIKTGPSYFNTCIIPKMEKIYTISQCIEDGIDTHVFELK